jgi:hypothetical protein
MERWMVELEPADAEARRAAWNRIKTTAGVVDLVDLRAINSNTLQTFLLPAERPRGRELRDIHIDDTKPVEHCRSCNALIWWGKTGSGKPNPFDVYDGARTAVTHFSTCPQANTWSKRGGKRTHA